MVKILKHSILFFILITSLLLTINPKFYSYKDRKTKSIFVIVNIDNSYRKFELKFGSKYSDLLNILNLDDTYNISSYSLDLPLYNNQIIEIRNASQYVSLNKASIEELLTLPGIGEVTANKIIEYRNNNKGFKYLEELKNVSGIGEKKYEKIKELISL